MRDSGPNIIVAMDVSSSREALQLAHQLDPETVRLKVGKELFTQAGPTIVRQLQDLDFDVFLDLKFHDIPNTVSQAVSAAADLGVWMVNVHATGGSRMMLQSEQENFQAEVTFVCSTVLDSTAAQKNYETADSHESIYAVTALFWPPSLFSLDVIYKQSPLLR